VTALEKLAHEVALASKRLLDVELELRYSPGTGNATHYRARAAWVAAVADFMDEQKRIEREAT
jgi:hypothetical protein